MAVEFDREEFRQYLKDSGAVMALSKVLMKLYELKANRPTAAVNFIHENLLDDLPSFTEFEILKKELEETKHVLEQLTVGGTLTESQLNFIKNMNKTEEIRRKCNDSMISARQSQIVEGNSDRISFLNGSKIRAIAKADENYSEKIDKIVEFLWRDSKCTSLLKRYLTPDVYRNLKNEETTNHTTLVDCVSSGLEIHESLIGVYAPEVDVYTTFGELFNPIIEDYHAGYGTLDQHPPLYWGDPSDFTDLDVKKEFISSMRIRCVRTVKEYPLIPKMTKEDFSSLYEKVKNVMENLSGELEGHWYGLEDVDPETKRDLINNRYVLEYGDRFLESAGAVEHWPIGRAVYINNSKTFFVWINEEDHLRFISMESGSNIPAIYSRLIDAVDQCSSKLNFLRDEHLGFVSLCPTNLGNTIRASVLIDLPKLTKHMKLEALTEKFNLEIRGSHEPQFAKSDMFEISNKRKLGLTEYESIKELHDGIKAIIQEELQTP
ncbi:Arginine kinase [Pseudolycoriella hygida]|uniref:arginine kinase n=1 Tax=Pseudolycoriella hygida TaxID=35572 RepID=A0A9Q0S7W4_9DIPT|nr:Arginine kinase [Pseudolycoriella hygida]